MERGRSSTTVNGTFIRAGVSEGSAYAFLRPKFPLGDFVSSSKSQCVGNWAVLGDDENK